jgi:hypothetical protein
MDRRTNALYMHSLVNHLRVVEHRRRGEYSIEMNLFLSSFTLVNEVAHVRIQGWHSIQFERNTYESLNCHAAFSPPIYSSLLRIG